MAPNNNHPDEEVNAENNNETLEQASEILTDQPMEPYVQHEL